jgi:AraC-like DNA-binding protein
VLDRAELGRRAASKLGQPHQTEFHRLMLVDNGQTWHEVDHTEYPLGPRTVLWVWPGQVQRFGPPVDAEVVLFTAGVPAGAFSKLAPLLGHRRGPVWHPHPDDYAGIREIARQLRLEASRSTATADEARRHLLSVLLLRITGTDTAEASPEHPDSLAARFAAEVERCFARTHRVADYARQLGYSVRTLTRASTAATGRSASEVIDARITLEAKRLLAYTDLTVATIGLRLGFSESTNFAKFFVRRTGGTPTTFRRNLAAPPSRRSASGAVASDYDRARSAGDLSSPDQEDRSRSSAGKIHMK